MLKDQSPKFKAAICNVLVDVVSACNTLSHPANINGLGIVIQGSCEGSALVPFSHVL